MLFNIFFFLLLLNGNLAQHFDAEYHDMSGTERSSSSRRKGNIEDDSTDSDNVTYSFDQPSNMDDPDDTYEGGRRDLGMYDFSYEDDNSVKGENVTRNDSLAYENDAGDFGFTDDRNFNGTTDDPEDDIEVHHPIVEVSDTGEHTLRDGVKVSCGISKVDPMEIRYSGIAYNVYTLYNGTIGCTSVNSRPHEHVILNAKMKSCLPQMEVWDDAWTVNLKVQKGPVRNPDRDYSYTIKCTYNYRVEKRITSATVNDGAKRKKYITIDVRQAEMGELRLEVTDPEGRPVSEATLGSPIRLSVTYQTTESDSGIKVWSCRALNGPQNTSEAYTFLVDGCGLGFIIPTEEGFSSTNRRLTKQGYEYTSSSVTFQAFKIPPTDVLYFQCTLAICFDSSSCQGESCRTTGRSKRDTVLFDGRHVKFTKISTQPIKLVKERESTNDAEIAIPKLNRHPNRRYVSSAGKPFYFSILGLCTLMLLLFVGTTICCAYVGRKRRREDPAYGEYVPDPSPISVMTTSTSLSAQIEHSSKDVGVIDFNWNAPANETAKPEAAIEVLNLHQNFRTKTSSVVRYTNGIQSTRSDRQE